jgi:hypothetical protein
VNVRDHLNPFEQATYDALIAGGMPRDRVDEIALEDKPHLRPPRQRTALERRALKTALHLDILDHQIAALRREKHEETRKRLQRLGFNTHKFRPLPDEPVGSELARTIERFSAPPPMRYGSHAERGMLFRPGIGEVVGVR